MRASGIKALGVMAESLVIERVLYECTLLVSRGAARWSGVMLHARDSCFSTVVLHIVPHSHCQGVDKGSDGVSTLAKDCAILSGK